MSTIEKALDLLNLFSRSTPSLGLSQIARAAGRDKASTLRHLAALENAGFLERDGDSRDYRLGPALARLALVRDETYPLAAARGVLAALVTDTGETAHLTEYSGGSMSEVAIVETQVRGTRVFIDPAELLPLHASASGIAWLAASADSVVDAVLGGPLVPATDNTLTDPRALRAAIDLARTRGFSLSRGSFERDVTGIGAAVRDARGRPVGAVAVAAPTVRVPDAVAAEIGRAVIGAATAISERLGWTPPVPQEAAQ